MGDTGRELLRRLLVGSLAKRVDTVGNEQAAVSRAIRTGEQRADEAAALERRAVVQEFAGSLLSAGPERGGAIVDSLWPTLDRTGRSVLVQALAEARARDRRFAPLHTKWRTANDTVPERSVPYVADELRRKQLVPITSRK